MNGEGAMDPTFSTDTYEDYTEERLMAKNWIENTLLTAPFSFKFNNEPSSAFITNDDWRSSPIWSKDSSGNDTVKMDYYNNIAKVRFTLKVILYKDNPTVEWVVSLKNEGALKSGTISELQAIDMGYTLSSATGNRLIYSKGSNSSTDDFKILTEDFNLPIVSKTLKAKGGRSSSDGGDGGYLPMFDINTPNGGIIIAVGWTGQWAATLKKIENTINIKAGMELTSFKLNPNEEARTPSISVTFYKGSNVRGHNVFRKLILSHDTPTVQNEKVTAFSSVISWGSRTDEYLRNIVDKFTVSDKNLVNYLWVDAEWNGGSHVVDSINPDPGSGAWENIVGDWQINTTLFPKGFMSVSNYANSKNMKFLLWFEPERAEINTKWVKEHPDYFLSSASNKKYKLLDLSNDKVRNFLTNSISDMITANGISVYRQDFNIEPLNFWREHDSIDRKGLTEIHYVENLYKFWDDLRVKHPNLIIDNCASGGRRIDIETLKRSVLPWRTDNQTLLAGQNTFASLAYWVPISGGGYPAAPNNIYEFRSCMGPFINLPDYYSTSVSNPYFTQKMLEQYEKVKPCYYGDYYPLSQTSTSTSDWLSYEFYRADMEKGMVMAFRRENCEEAEQTVCLLGLVSDWTYEIEDIDTGEKLISTGEQLMEKGLVMKTKDKNESKLYFFEKVKG
jgi:alpha-galactosidase